MFGGAGSLDVLHVIRSQRRQYAGCYGYASGDSHRADVLKAARVVEENKAAYGLSL
jgi:hypothetical protein